MARINISGFWESSSIAGVFGAIVLLVLSYFNILTAFGMPASLSFNTVAASLSELGFAVGFIVQMALRVTKVS